MPLGVATTKLTGAMWPTWQQAAITSVLLTALALACRARTRGWIHGVGQFAGETALVSFLYMLWRLARFLPFEQEAGAFQRGRDIWELQRDLFFPSELAMERWVLRYEWLARAFNVFYATAHVPALLAFLVWLFVRHRDRYGPWRNTLAITTGFCLVIRFWRVAPPRLLPELGFIDMARLFDQSVYGPPGTGVSDQLAAMPSIHCAWAILVGIAIVRVSPSRWRWLAVAHPVLTVLSVVVTANHWWLDAVVAALLLWLAWWIDAYVRRLVFRRRAGRAAGDLETTEPSLV